MADTLTERLFQAIDIIASKKVSDLPYDQTVICTILDNSNAHEGVYTVTDGTSTFDAYSENDTYRINNRVYVTIPNGDMDNNKHITGLYVVDDTDRLLNCLRT